MKGRYVIDTDELLLKSIKKGTHISDTSLRKAVKIHLLKEYIKDEGVTINKSFALLGLLTDE